MTSHFGITPHTDPQETEPTEVKMRILLAGATGVLGQLLVPLLVAEGHEVLGLTRRTAGAESIKRAGALAAVCDVYDLDRLTEVVSDFGPEAVVHQLTDLPDDPACIDDAANARIRTEGTDNLIHAARMVGATRLLAQSIAWPLPGAGGAAVAHLEREVLHARGAVVRYGRFYGPGTPTTRLLHPSLPAFTLKKPRYAHSHSYLRTPASTGLLTRSKIRCALAATDPQCGPYPGRGNGVEVVPS